MHEDELTRRVIGSAMAVHRELGPGLLESVYRACLIHELDSHKLAVSREVPLPITYHGVRLDCGYRLDLVVEDRLIVEVKCVKRFDPIHSAQLLTYLRLSGNPVGLLINFHVVLLKYGIRRLIDNPRMS